jgi:c-di-GMP-binding flagellar brake protein YcgR
VIEQLSSVKVTQNRQFFRVEVNFPCAFSVVPAGAAPAQATVVEQARVRDISGGGVRLVTGSPIAKGNLLALKITLHSGSNTEDQDQPSPRASSAPPLGRQSSKSGITPAPVRAGRIMTPAKPLPEVLELRGLVIHVSETPSDAGPVFVAGVQFVEVSNRLQERLMMLVFDIQRAQCHSH